MFASQSVSYKHLTPRSDFFIKFVFCKPQSRTMPKNWEKHDKKDLDKVSKILVETNIDPKKVQRIYPSRENKTFIL